MAGPPPRLDGCPYTSSCLGVACRRSWSGMSCGDCPIYLNPRQAFQQELAAPGAQAGDEMAMGRKSKLDALKGEAGALWRKAIMDEGVTAKALHAGLLELGVNEDDIPSVDGINKTLRGRRQAAAFQAAMEPKRTKPTINIDPEEGARTCLECGCQPCACDDEAHVVEHQVEPELELEVGPEHELDAPYAVRPDGMILARTAEAAVAVARLLCG